MQTLGTLTSLMNIAQGALDANTAVLGTTGQNVANVSTPGYAREVPVLETAPDNSGVDVQSVQRVVDQYAEAAVVTETGNEGAANARSDALTQTQSTVAPGTGMNISDQVSAFYSAMTTVSQDPSDPSARGAAVSAATQVATSISSTAGQLTSQRASLLSQAQGVAGTVNQDLTTIASLNQQIAQGNALGQDTSALQDQRDSAIEDVGSNINVSAIPDKTGAVTLLSSGTTLVEGNDASSLSVGLDSSGNLSITAQEPGGTPNDITQNVTSGALGGIREARDVDIPAVSSQLDQFAYDFENNVNSIQEAGYGLDGATGRPLFTPPTAVQGAAFAMSVNPTVANDPSELAASGSAADLPGGNDAALAMAALASQPQGTASSPAAAFGALTETIGTSLSAANAEVTLRQNTVAQATNLRDSVSGVSLNDEMVNLTRYQQSYQASVQVLQTADSLLEGLMQDL
jgi:flagellar hook-associated protein 1 FlgK